MSTRWDDYNNITLISNNKENIYTFPKIIKYNSELRKIKNKIIFNNIELRFLDSYKFISRLLSQFGEYYLKN